MGYYTTYTLEYKSADGWTDGYQCALRNIVGYNTLGMETKWYSFKEDMITLSRKFPDTVFCLSGEGESFPDFWKSYFINGKSQHCKGELTFEEFNINKLK